jgi:hypothetical protein
MSTHAPISGYIVKTLLPLGAIVAIAVAPNACSKEPDTRCGIETSEAIARYTPTSMPKDLMPMACANLAMGQGGLPPDPAVSQSDQSFLALGTEEYLPSPQDPNQDNEKRSMAIKAEWIGNRIQGAQALVTDMMLSDAQHKAMAIYPYSATNPQPPKPADMDPGDTNRPYSWGTFDQFYPDANGVCRATLTASEMDYPVIPANTMNNMETPLTHVRYEWSNVRVVVHNQSVGQQIYAHLVITQDGCQGEYDVSILAPRVACNEYALDGGATGTGDPGQCSANSVTNVPQPSGQQLYGSGLPTDIIDTIKCQNLGGPPVGDGGTPPADWECMPTKTGP